MITSYLRLLGHMTPEEYNMLETQNLLLSIAGRLLLNVTPGPDTLHMIPAP